MEQDFIAEALADGEIRDRAMQQNIAAIVGMLEKSTLLAAEEAVLQNRLQNLRLSTSSITKTRLMTTNSDGEEYPSI